MRRVRTHDSRPPLHQQVRCTTESTPSPADHLGAAAQSMGVGATSIISMPMPVCVCVSVSMYMRCPLFVIDDGECGETDVMLM